MAFGDRARLTNEIHSQYLHPFSDPGSRKGCWVFPQQIVGAAPWLERLWRNRRRMADKAFREKELHRWGTVFPDARVARLDDVGRFLPEEAGDRLMAAVEEFLE